MGEDMTEYHENEDHFRFTPDEAKTRGSAAQVLVAGPFRPVLVWSNASRSISRSYPRWTEIRHFSPA